MEDFTKAINLQIDATFFGREYGFLVFHDCQKVIYFKEIKTESIKHFREGIIALKASNYRIASVRLMAEEDTLTTSESCLEIFQFKCACFTKKPLFADTLRTGRDRSVARI